MGLWSSGLPSALQREATTVRGTSPRKQVTSVQRLGRGFGHASCSVTPCAIDRSPAGENPLADVGLEVRAVLTKAELDAVQGS